MDTHSPATASGEVNPIISLYFHHPRKGTGFNDGLSANAITKNSEFYAYQVGSGLEI